MTNPKDVSRLLGSPALKAQRESAALERALAVAKQEGRSEARQEYLTWLEKRYMGSDVERGTDLGKAILTIAKEMALHFRQEIVRGKGR